MRSRNRLRVYGEIGGVLGEKPVDRRRAVPVVHLEGSHYEVGYDVGRIFASVIKNYIDLNPDLEDFEKEYKTDNGRAVYDKTLANMKRRFPYYVKEIQGIADGANVSFHQLFLMHLDDIIGTVNDNHIPRKDAGGCTSIGLQKPDATVLGHTEDALLATVNHFYIMTAHIIPTTEDKKLGAVEERFASVCYAGQLPGYTSGFNQNGLVFSINTLSPLVLKPGSTPRTFITRAVLTAKNYADAERILRDEGLGAANGFSINMIWSEASGIRQMYNVEVAPDLNGNKSLVNVQKFDKEPLTHCNMYQHLNVTEVVGEIIDSSVSRLHAISKHPTPRNKKDVKDILSDTTSEFRIFEDRNVEIVTISASIFDLDKMTWSVFINKPNVSEPVAVLPIVFNKYNN